MMGRRGPKSTAALSVAKVAKLPQRIPDPPVKLDSGQRAIWDRVMASAAGKHIAPEAFDVAVEYCRTGARLNAIENAVSRLSPTDRDYRALVTLAERLGNRLSQIGTKLRLNPKSVYRVSRGEKAWTPDPNRKAWDYTGYGDGWDPEPD